jgi:hypothetical protein
MESVATYTADVIRGIGVMIGYIKTASEAISKVPGLNKIMGLVLSTNPLYEPIVLLNKLGKEAAANAARTGDTAQALAHLAELQSAYADRLLKTKTKLTAEELKALKAAKLKAAIDKANLALNKGSDVFDMDKIQIAAALTNQAEALGKATSASQALQIANDTARLNVKKSILALEDAIASKDEASIVAATNKLNADLKVLGALTGQSIKLSDIKSILESLKPADLINLANLDAAIAKMLELIRLQGTKPPTTPSAGGGAYSTVAKVAAITAKLPASVTATDFFNSLTEDEQAQLGGYQPFVGAKIPTTVPYDSGGSGAGFGNNGSGRQVPQGVTINVTAPPFTDPNAIAEAIDEVLRQARDRGTLTAV